MTDCGDRPGAAGRRRGARRAPRRLHRPHGGDARALPGLARRPRPPRPRASLPLLRAGHDRARARGRRRPGPDRGRPPGMGAAARAGASPARPGHGRAPRPRLASDALRATPLTFVAGDWKFGNVGHRPDGRTVLLDWAYPGEAPPCWDLAWYLALNRARLPESKEATIARYRERLEQRGVDTSRLVGPPARAEPVGMAAVFAWEKAVGDPDRAGLVGAGRPGRREVALTVQVRRHGRGWAGDASLAYDPLARHLVARHRSRSGGIRRSTRAPDPVWPARRCAARARGCCGRPRVRHGGLRRPGRAGGPRGRHRAAVPGRLFRPRRRRVRGQPPRPTRWPA